MCNQVKLLRLQDKLGWKSKDLSLYLQYSISEISRMRRGLRRVRNHIIDSLITQLAKQEMRVKALDGEIRVVVGGWSYFRKGNDDGGEVFTLLPKLKFNLVGDL